MFKRVSSVIMAIAMMLTMLCTFCIASAAAPMSPVITVDAADGEYARGDLVEVTVGVKDYVKLCLMSIQLTADEDVLKLSLADGNVEEDFTYATTKFGAPGAVNPKTLFINWAFSSNKVVRDSGRNEMSEFDLITLFFEIPDDAPYGESTITVAFAEKDSNGGNGMCTTPSAGVVNPLVKDTDYTTAPASVTINISCPHANKGTELTQPVAGTAEADAKHGYLCGDCGELVDAAACDFEDISEPETCDKNGVDGIECKDCGYKIATTIDEIDGHDWQPDGLDAKENGKHICSNDGCGEEEACDFIYIESQVGDCVNDETVTYACTVCFYEYTKTTTAPGHELVPSPSEPGHHYCANCNEVYAACVYNIDVSSSGATCQKPGETVKACVCGDTKTTTSTLEHSFGEYISNEDGTHTATCTTCVPAEGEVAVDVKNCDYEALDASDCEKDGTKKCKECGYVTVNEEDLSAGHDWSDWEHVEDTDTHTRTCGNANCPVGTETKDCSGTAVPTGPSCDERGYTTTVCDDCGEEYVVIDETEAGDPLGHEFDWTHTVEYEGTSAETHFHASNGACLNGCGESVAKEECVFTVVDEPNCVDGGEAVCDICEYVLDLDPLGDGWHENMVTVYKPVDDEEGGYFCDTCADCGTEVSMFYETEAGAPFADLSVDSNVWFAAPANFCYTYGGLIIGEYGNFNGDGLVTRGQVVTVLGRHCVARYGHLLDDELDVYEDGDAWINGLSDEEFQEILEYVAEICDVEPAELSDLNNQYYSRYARLMAALGVVRGRDDGTFDGDAKVNRAELAAMLVRYIDTWGINHEFENPSATFADLANCGWATEVVEYAGELGLFQGDEHGKFNPWATATRGQLATLMERLIRASEWYEIVSPDYFD